MYEVAQNHDGKKAAVIILIRLASGAETKAAEDIKVKIQRVLEEGLADVPWLVLENVTVVSE
jgi:hypothetical protein